MQNKLSLTFTTYYTGVDAALASLQGHADDPSCRLVSGPNASVCSGSHYTNGTGSPLTMQKQACQIVAHDACTCTYERAASNF